MKSTLLSVALLLTPILSHSQETDAEKTALIEELLEQTGQSSLAVGMQLANAFIQQIAQVMQLSNPQLDPRALEIVEEEVGLVIQEQFVDEGMFDEMLHPIYDKHFSADELSDIIAFYATPTGEKTLDLMPLISQESMQAGEQFGLALGPKIQRRVTARLDAEGFELK